ncbi:MAG: hypothetical protein IPK04_04210 [Bdellovibrionales bacterium]|nr:hypothetical protein [Bdellovibrionales bacterium]
MSQSNHKVTKKHVDVILNFVDQSGGLRVQVSAVGRVSILQEADGKVFSFESDDISEVLTRSDSDNRPFVQINFQNTKKVLLTETLVGFKPKEILGLDMSRIPKVVTTPDLVSVYEAIEESLGSESSNHEVEILKKVYLAILDGGDSVGFDLRFEKKWLTRLLASRTTASA